MKKQFLLLAAIALACGVQAQSTVHNLDFDAQRSEVSILDIDMDGDNDILILGQNPNGRQIQLFQNKGDMTFEKVESPLASTWVPTVDFGDYNRDGMLDIIQSGFADSVIVNLYAGDGEGAYTLDPFYKDLIHIAPSCTFSDLNNDGITDIIVFGNHNIEDQRPKLYFGNASGGFTAQSPFDAYKFIDSKVVDVDFDNDGDMDLWVMAGYEEGVDARFARLFVNDNGTFTAKDMGIIAKGPGSSDWGDYDGDGDLDLLIGGWGYVNSGEDDDKIYRIYKNNAGSLVEAVVFKPFGQFGVGDGSRFADWDNDGDLDVILTGWNPDDGTQRTAFFINALGSFTEAEYGKTVPGFSESALEVGDLDGDGDLDVVVNGFSGNNWNGDGSALGKNSSVIIENTTADSNEAPSAPTNLAVTANGTSIKFSWKEAADDKTPSKSLTYNFFLIDENGTFFYTPLADTTTGRLYVQEKGNVQLNKSWTVKNLPYGTYRWGVQAIDHSFAGSAFAATTLFHTEGGTVLGAAPVALPLVYPNPVVGPVNVRAEKGLSAVAFYTVEGKQVASKQISESNAQVSFNLKAGIYLMKAFYNDGRVVSDKIIVK